jgi:hypothetical protein
MRYNPLKIIVRVIGSGSARDGRLSFLCRRTITAFVIATSLLLALPRPTRSCGPFFTDAIFVYTKHPDFPLERFAQGQLGVIQPGYARSYLFAAYRNLIAEALSAKESSALQSLWDDRLNYGGEIDDAAWIKTWTEARKQVSGVNASPDIRAFRRRDKPHEYESYLNCQKDAFEMAAATLNERIKRYGADSAELRNWVAAQDIVFANCSEGQSIPEPLAGSADALVLADRAYQIAAANFYGGNFDAATKEFDEIARDRRSPWHEQAPYLAARSLVRKASLAEKEEAGKSALAEAETRLKSIQGGEHKFTSMDLAVARLSNLVRLRLHPEDKLHELAHSIVKKDASADFKRDVWDFTILLDRFLGDDVEETTRRPVPEALRQDDVTDWILSLQGGPADALPHSLERWDKTHSLPWLVAAITNASGNTANLPLLLSAAGRVDHSSPAFASVALHSVRLLTESGRNTEARQMLDRILATDRSKLPSSAVNLLLSQRTVLAQNLEEFLQSAQRVPAGFSDDNDSREIPEEEAAIKETTKGSQFFFDVDAVNVFNKAMPLDVLRDAALSRTLAVNLRRDVTQAAFMRASLVDDRDNAARLGMVLGELYPELRSLLTAYQRASTPDARRFASAYLSLKFPGLRPYVTSGVGRSTPLAEIDSYRDNWWCAEPPAPFSGPASEGEGADGSQAKAKRIKPPGFLAAFQTTAAKQSATLRALGPGPNYLCQAVIEWASKNPADPRVPEALHLAVKSTRYGCTDKETGRWSKATFDLLHSRYPNSPWARQTKYWFKD